MQNNIFIYYFAFLLDYVKHQSFQEVLQGFCLASQPPLIKKHYPPPTLPANFKPIHLKPTSNITQNANLRVSRHALSASDRSLLLGEKKFQKASLNGEMQKIIKNKIY